MQQLKGDVEELVYMSFDERQKKEGVTAIMEQIDNTIDTASRETFLPTNELLGITKELLNIKNRMGSKTPTAQAILKQCFRTLNMAALSLKQITEDCALMEANELSKQEI
ncbi:MAG: hypothetical protein IKH26_04865 [Bacteroidaceae bacterium]|nr:hypothetical protein [Bacteroidaceae bacterium]